MYLIDELLYFPPVNQADAYGLLAIGGDLNVDRLVLAYKSGIFPWFEADQPILWYSPNPRMILAFKNLKVSKSMSQLLKKKPFTITINQCFSEVITRCAKQKRKNQTGTWITDNMISAYTKLHELGIALSVEVWQGNTLVGGLYGVNLKEQKVFCGESMFTEVNNASKVAFIYMCRYFEKKGYKFIDCQMHNDHLESLGAIEIPRNEFINALQMQ